MVITTMKKEFNINKWLDNDKVVKLIALIIAIISWLIIAITVAPNGTKIIDNIPVKMELVNSTPAANELSIIKGADQKVSATIEGKNYKLGNLTKKDFIAVPILTQVTKAGEYKISVEVKKINEKDIDYDVVSLPSIITMEFDYIVEKSMPLLASAEKVKASEGYIKDEPYANIEKIDLNGPKSEIEKIAKCVISSDEERESQETVTLGGKLKFYDKNDVEITNTTNIKHLDQTFEIIVPISKHKIVPVKINFVNVPQGLDISKLGYTMSVDTLEIAGPKKIIDECKEISLGEMDFRTINVGTTQEFDVELRAGITNIGNVNKVTITINEKNLMSKQFSIKNILTKNVPANFNIDVKTTSVNNVKIVGNVFDMEKLTANDLVATIDFTDVELTAGTTRVPITIYVTGNKFAWAVGEYKAVVNSTKK
ncbi:MAG: hypothetical protein RSA99_02810 [Oscillospiraceae bacterium]